ncbi:unnamed protein product [Urochloa humidicola]
MAPPPLPKLIEDAIAEILTRLPPDDPACLQRAAFVCKTWCRVLSDPAFLRRPCSASSATSTAVAVPASSPRHPSGCPSTIPKTM